MKIYLKIISSQVVDELKKIEEDFESRFPGLDLHVYEMEHKIQVQSIRVPLEFRRQGIGSEIINAIKEYARKVGKPISLSPQAERGYKDKLERFYKDLGFKWNKGRNRDYTISDPFGSTMYWKPN